MFRILENIRIMKTSQFGTSPNLSVSDSNALLSFSSNDNNVSFSTQKNPFITTDLKIIFEEFTMEAGISAWAPSILKTDNEAIIASHKSLIDLLKYYEGDRYHYYEAVTVPYEDKYGTWTTGFGTKGKKRMTYEQAYTEVKDHLLQSLREIKDCIGEDYYTKLPSSLKEGLLDLCYNKGASAVKNVKDQIKIAIDDSDWSTVISCLAYVTSAKTDAKKVDDPGLYRRSLSRMILAARDLTGRELKQTETVIKNFYERALGISNQSKIDVEKIYSAYKNKVILETPVDRESAKHKVLKNESYYSIAHNYCPDGEDLNKFIEHLIKINYKISLHPDDMITVPLVWNNKRTKISSMVSEITSSTSTTRQSVTNSSDSQDNVLTYQVKEGDSYYKIVRAQYPMVTDEQVISSIVTELQNKNNKNDTLKAGMTVTLLTDAEVDTLVSAKAESDTVVVVNDVKINENDDWNEKSTLSKMQEMVDARILTQNVMPLKSISNTYVREYVYTVKEGDYLIDLADKFGLNSYKEFYDYNSNLKENIKPGDEIKLPIIVYKLAKGDNLTKIYNQTKIPVVALQNENSLTDVTNMQIGQEICLPGSVYEVKSGDTLSNIAKKYCITIKELKSMNNKKDNLIKPGDILVIYNSEVEEASEPLPNVTPNANSSSSSDSSSNTSAKPTSSSNLPLSTKRPRGYTGMTIVNGDEERLKSRPLMQKQYFKDGVGQACREKFLPKKGSEKGILAGRTIIVNAGHGFKQDGTIDPGALGNKNAGVEPEAYEVYDFCMRLKDKLCACGATVIFIQGYEDASHSRGLAVASGALEKEENKGDLLVSVHLNSSKNSPTDRMEIYYNGKYSSSSINLAKALEAELDADVCKNKKDYTQIKNANHQITRTAATSKNQGIDGILWELCFINSKNGQKVLNDSNILDAYCNAFVNAAAKHLNSTTFHTVQRGETLSGIADEYNTSVNEIKKANNLQSNTIRTGQKLKIPI